MKKALIICAAGMSSSLMAKKVTEYFASKDKAISVDAVSATEGNNMIKNSDFSLFLAFLFRLIYRFNQVSSNWLS